MPNELLNQYFKDNDVEIKLFPEETIKKFDSFEEFKNFFVKEFEFWKRIERRGGRFRNIFNKFHEIHERIKSSLSTANNTEKTRFLKEAISLANISKAPCIYSMTTVGIFFESVYDTTEDDKGYQIQDGAYNFLFEINMAANSTGEIEGAIRAFNFKNNINNKHIDFDEKSLINIKQDFIDSKDELSESIKKLKEDIENFNNNSQKSIENVQSELQNSIENKNKKFEELLKISEEKLNKIENKYDEILRFDKPAKYWKTLEEEYNKKGNNWYIWAVLYSIATCLLLVAILYNFPTAFRSDNTYENIRATIIFGVIISIFVYLITLFIKLSISAFHLSRDAKERHQLTHFYLSLLEKDPTLKDERNIILQSLFARSETGLLKGDSSPTLPSGILEKIIKNMK